MHLKHGAMQLEYGHIKRIRASKSFGARHKQMIHMRRIMLTTQKMQKYAIKAVIGFMLLSIFELHI